MTSMFVTSCGKDRAPQRRFRALGALVTFGLSACAGTDDGQNMMTSPPPTGSVTSVTPVATNSGPAPSVNPPAVNPNPVNPVNPVNPAPTTTATSGAPVQPPVNPTNGPVTPDPTAVTPSVTSSPTTTSSSTGGPGPEPTSPGPGGTCTIAATGEISAKISTVGVVTFTVDVPVTSAKIEFKNMAGGETITAPVDLEAEGYRTLILGMKPNATYTYKVVVNDTCSSAEGSLTTGAIPVSADQKIPRISKTGSGGQPGFYVVSVYSANTHSVILDQDGEIVWYGGGATGGNDGTSRSRMDWEGKHMWSVAANPFAGGGGAIMKVSMDGETQTSNLPGTENRHHDLVAVPGGIMTILAHQAQGGCSRIIEYGPDGTAKEIVSDINEIYQSVMDCHPNSISYNVDDDTYVVGDRNASMFVKFDREGNVIWQLGGSNPVGPSFQGAGTWNISHGHHLFEQDGSLRMLVFNNASGGTSNVLEYSLNEDAMTAEQIWKAGVAATPVMGDVQRLPNGNTLVALTTAGSIIEYTSGTNNPTSVQEFKVTGAQVGYVDYRPTLYGIPAKARFDYKSFE